MTKKQAATLGKNLNFFSFPIKCAKGIYEAKYMRKQVIVLVLFF